MTISPAQKERYKRELGRLETLIDSVFALVIVLIAFDIPRPDELGIDDFGQFLKHQAMAIATSAISLAVVLVYWFQSNALLGNLVRTDGKHAVFSVFQVFAVLIYLYAVGIGIDLDNNPPSLALQSLAAALVGFMAAAAWWYASKDDHLLSPDISREEIGALRLRVLAEPLTAVLTFILAVISPLLWEIGWLAYPLFAALLRRAGVHDK
ncbi:MAG: TMEM175 family protein [Woeseiaceae bacterium]